MSASNFVKLEETDKSSTGERARSERHGHGTVPCLVLLVRHLDARPRRRLPSTSKQEHKSCCRVAHCSSGSSTRTLICVAAPSPLCSYLSLFSREIRLSKAAGSPSPRSSDFHLCRVHYRQQWASLCMHFTELYF